MIEPGCLLQSRTESNTERIKYIRTTTRTKYRIVYKLIKYVIFVKGLNPGVIS